MPPRRYLHGNVYEKDGFWHMRFRLPTGLDTRRKIGRAWKARSGRPPAGYYTERTARAELEKILSKYEGFTTGSDPSVKQAAEEFLEHCKVEKKLRATTLSRYAQIIEHDILPEIGEKALSRVTETNIVDLRANLADRVSASSLNQTKIVLKGIVKYARKVRKYPGDDISEWFDRAVIQAKTHIEVFSPAEIELIARTLRESKHRKNSTQGFRAKMTEPELAERNRIDDQDAVIVKTSAYAGLRLSEIRALRWRDIDFAGSKITIRSGYTDAGGEGAPKSGRARTVPMAQQLATELDNLSRREKYTEPDDLVFCGVFGETLSGSGIYHRYIEGCKAAGLRRLTFHALRHSFCSMAVQAFPLTDVKEFAGHADISTTMRYVHFVPQTEIAQKLSDLFAEKLGTGDLESVFRAENSPERSHS